MESYLTLIASKTDALRLPKINHENDLTTVMDYGAFSSMNDVNENAKFFSMFSFNENHVKKTTNRLNFASFEGEHCLTFNLLPFRFYSTDGETAGKEARKFIKDIGLDMTDHTHALFQEIKDDQSNETFVYIHAAVCGALLIPSRTLCDELYNLGSDLSKLYPSLDREIYKLDAMNLRNFGDSFGCRRGDWPLEGMSFEDMPQSSALKALILEATRKRVTT